MERVERFPLTLEPNGASDLALETVEEGLVIRQMTFEM